MGSTYTRQSTFTDGDTITADLFNTEFDQLVAAFAASSGHSHDCLLYTSDAADE